MHFYRAAEMVQQGQTALTAVALQIPCRVFLLIPYLMGLTRFLTALPLYSPLQRVLLPEEAVGSPVVEAVLAEAAEAVLPQVNLPASFEAVLQRHSDYCAC
jgi:hypothetical protein